jgi:hypothetical protein
MSQSLPNSWFSHIAERFKLGLLDKTAPVKLDGDRKLKVVS